ncbi:MAG: histidine ammonia-lyase [Bacteroides sp.]|jgi:histidine ammonia-lyase|nr:histidine ammonia-lyase [Bacteroides sp.]
METHHISPQRITLDTLKSILQKEMKLDLSEESRQRIIACRNYLDEKIRHQNEPIYGVTTGFGSLCNHSISRQELGTLQKNLVMSHACGMGEELSPDLVRLMLILKIQSLSYGHSGIRLETVERLIDFFNYDILPVVYSQGSLGASGDLAPLAHLSLPLLGLGDVIFEGQRMSAAEVLKLKGWQPLELASKEGLALLNGTQFMAAIGSYCLMKARELSLWADFTGALSLEGFDGKIEPFLEQVHLVRHHEGQIETARQFRKILEGSLLINQKKGHVQDPYSFRCIPQVHGASKDAISYVCSVFENEINAVTDNPTIFPEGDLIISAGNFHGQPLAITLDFLGIALAELGNISERRVYRLISGARQLPSFLVAHPGLNSGFMIPQYTAASIVSQNKQYCTPASVDSIESSQGQEDHVSMGANAAVKTLKIVDNLAKLLAIELLNASQAMEFRDARKTSPVLKKLLKDFRQKVPFVEDDVVMYAEMGKALQFIKEKDPLDYLV